MPRAGILLETLAWLRRLKQAAERAEARVEFALERRKRLTPLTSEQVQRFHRDGYLIVSGLIAENQAREAETAMWEALGADPAIPYSWPRLGPPPHVLKDERIMAIYTDAMLAAAAQLAGEDVAGFRRPRHTVTVNRTPVSGEWHRDEPHLDRVASDYRCRTFPRPYRIGAMTYLTDVPPHGGGTIVWPGSHHIVEALARSSPRKYRYLSALYTDLAKLSLGPPVELTPMQGDVFFHHYLCVHAGSENVSHTVRLAMNHKW